ncbi:MAG: hypothetical protein RXP89_03375 [Nitrososphaeria archaeon]
MPTSGEGVGRMGGGAAWLRSDCTVRLRSLVLASLAEQSRVRARSALPAIPAAGLGPLREGEDLEVPRILGLALIAAGAAAPADEGVEVELYRAQGKERAAAQSGSPQLSQLRPGFYRKVASSLAAMELAGMGEAARRALSVYQDLMTLRLQKVARSLGYTSVPASLPNATDEERALFECASAIFRRWREIMEGVDLVGGRVH